MGAAKKLDAEYTVLETHMVFEPKKRAELFGACLGADRAVGSRIVRVSATTYDCVADDNRAIRFTAPTPLRRVK